MKHTLFIVILSISVFANAQNLDDVLSQIEQNNTTLKALRQQAEADKLENKTGLTPDNPEINIGYLWGNPADTGNELSYSITQSFDFPTAYVHRSQVANARNAQVMLHYEYQKRELLHDARTVYINWVHYKKKAAQLTERSQQAEELFSAYQKLLDAGETTMIEYNKTRLNRLSLEKATQLNDVEIATFESELKRLNGNNDLIIGEAILQNSEHKTLNFELGTLNFDTWFENVKRSNPAFVFVEKEIEVSRQEEKLRVAENLPKLSTGYYSEQLAGVRMQGVQAGISIPLWEGKNTVKQQKAKTAALQEQQIDYELQFKNTLKNSYNKAQKLSQLLNEYSEMLAITNNQQLLDKALQLGQLTLIDYLQELTVFYDILDQYLETELEYNLVLAELKRWE
jgi:Outer membrane protein